MKKTDDKLKQGMYQIGKKVIGKALSECNIHSVSGSDLEKADMWYCLHKNQVNKLFNSTKTEYPPTELEDIKNPNLWKAEHWRWFLNNYR